MPSPVEIKISVVKVVGSPFCVSIDDGHLLHDRITRALDAGNFVELSFDGVKRLTTAFLNASMGQLYNEYTEEQIRQFVRIVEASQDSLRLIKRVVDNAKRFFSDPIRGSEQLKRLLDDE